MKGLCGSCRCVSSVRVSTAEPNLAALIGRATLLWHKSVTSIPAAVDSLALFCVQSMSCS